MSQWIYPVKREEKKQKYSFELEITIDCDTQDTTVTFYLSFHRSIERRFFPHFWDESSKINNEDWTQKIYKCFVKKKKSETVENITETIRLPFSTFLQNIELRCRGRNTCIPCVRNRVSFQFSTEWMIYLMSEENHPFRWEDCSQRVIAPDPLENLQIRNLKFGLTVLVSSPVAIGCSHSLPFPIHKEGSR